MSIQRILFEKIWFQHYRTMKTILNVNKSRTTIWWYRLVEVLLFGIIVRAILIYIDMAYKIDFYLKHDGFISLLEPKKNYEASLAICFAMLLMFFAYANRFLFINFTKFAFSILPFLRDIHVDNTTDVLENNQTLLGRLVDWNEAFHEPSKYFRESKQLISDLWHQERSTIKPENRIRFGQILGCFPKATAQCRVRLFMILMGFEFYIVGMCLVAVLGMFGAIGYYGHLMWIRNYPWHQFVTIMLDECHILLIALIILKYALVVVIIVVATLYTFSSLFLDLNRLASKLRESVRHWKLTKMNQMYFNTNKGKGLTLSKTFAKKQKRFCHHLWYFTKENCYVTGCILEGRDVWSPLFLAFIVSNLPMNIYLLTYMFYREVTTTIDRIFIIGILTIQMLSSLIALLPIGMTAKAAHGSAKYLPRLQHSTIGDIRLKWKFMVRYEIINSDDMIGYNAGPLGVVTNKVLFESIFMYTGYLMFVADLLTSG